MDQSSGQLGLDTEKSVEKGMITGGKPNVAVVGLGDTDIVTKNKIGKCEDNLMLYLNNVRTKDLTPEIL